MCVCVCVCVCDFALECPPFFNTEDWKSCFWSDGQRCWTYRNTAVCPTLPVARRGLFGVQHEKCALVLSEAKQNRRGRGAVSDRPTATLYSFIVRPVPVHCSSVQDGIYALGKKTYALHPVFPRRCLRNSSNVRLMNDGSSL